MALVVFLRGVNVGGHRTFRPTVLAKELAELDVVNVGAAGTFVIRQPVTQARMRAELASSLPFDTQIMICRGRDILGLMSHSHFASQPMRPDIVRFVSVLSRAPRSAPLPPVSLPASGKWLLKILAREHRFVFGVYRRQMKAIGYLGEIDRLFGVPATTRNWSTITAVAKVLGNRQTRPTRKPSPDKRGERELLPNKPMQRPAFGRR
jgi:uncharacterized protein (DUF1697 family)